MEILECKRCGEVWCYHGTGRALRCGKCKSPYWDRERLKGEGNAEDKSGGGKESSERIPASGGHRDSRVVEHKQRVDIRVEEHGCASSVEYGVDEGSGGNEEAVESCGFRAYNEGDGEWYTCGLPPHGPKVKHGAWVKQ